MRNLRRNQSLQAPSVTTPHRIPLATPIQNRDASFDKDARLVNALAEINPGEKTYIIKKRIGVAKFVERSGNGLGAYNWLGNLYTVFGTTLYKDGVSFGTVDGTEAYAFEELRGLGWLVLGNGVKAYYTDGITLTEMLKYAPVYDGALAIDSSYEIVTVGTSDFTEVGAATNSVGTQFIATNIGDPLTTGTLALVAPSILKGVTYEIYALGDTDFTLIGATANTVGTTFVATGPGTGTGSVFIPNFPAEFVKGWAYLDGTLYVMDAASKIYGTSTLGYGGIGGFDDPRIWDPLNLIVARSEAGAGISIGKHLTYVLAFKEQSVEPFYDAESPTGSPLHRVEGSQGVYGCASADSIQSVDHTLLWLTYNRDRSPQIARMDNLRAEIVSTPPIDRLLAKVDRTQVRSWSMKMTGHRLYGLVLPNINITLIYDLDVQLWYQFTDGQGNYWPYVAAAVNSAGLMVLQHISNGWLYYTAPDYEYANDDDVIVPVDIYTPNYDGGVDRIKMLSMMHFVGDQVPGGKLLVRFSEDDYQSWTNFREVNMGNKRPMLIDCGSFHRRAWHFRYYANAKLRLTSVDLQMDIGTL